MKLAKLALRIIPATAFLLLVVALGAQATMAGPNQDTARGRVVQPGQTVVFSAQSSPTGFNASGSVRFTFRNTDPNQVIEGDVTCLRVVGATATTPATAFIGGVVTKAPPGSGAASFVITASDSGKFATAPDTFNGFTTSAPPPVDGACPTTGFAGPVADGEVIIENALP